MKSLLPSVLLLLLTSLSSPLFAQQTYALKPYAITLYILFIQCGNGGTAYGVQPGNGGLGTQIASLNSSALLYQSGDIAYGQRGSFPGGGGGGGYNYGSNGANGMIVIHW